MSLPRGSGCHLTCTVIEMGVAVCIATKTMYKSPDSDMVSIACRSASYKIRNHSTETFE